MAHRKRMKRSRDKKVYTKTAKKTKTINLMPKIMRGGTRL